MNQNEFLGLVFDLAKDAGFESYELYFQEGNALELSSFEGEIVKYADSTTKGVNFRGIYQGKLGSAYSECFDEEAARMLVFKAKEIAELIEVEDKVFIYPGAPLEAYHSMALYDETLRTVSVADKIDLVLKQEALALDSGKLSKVSGSYYGDGTVSLRMVNSEGLDVAYTQNRAYAYLGAIGTDQGATYSAYAFGIQNNFEKLRAIDVAHKAVSKVVRQFGSRTVPSGEYPVIIENGASGNLLDVFMSLFSADAAQKGMSLFKDKVGTRVASERVHIVDNPHLENGLASAPFDGEGVPTRFKYLVKEGELVTLLHNLKTAHKAGLESTGNASRASYQSVIGVSHTNAYIEPGNLSLEDMISHMDRGLIITGFDGLHAGANAITGEFSLGARGFYVESGKIAYPVNQIVVSGNYMHLLENVLAVGNDLLFETQPVGSPSLMIKALAVAGA